MGDNVCDSWEDVDVDKIVIKPRCKSKKKPSAFDDDFEKFVNNDFNNVDVNFTGMKILQRTPTSGISTTGATDLPINVPNVVFEDNNRTQFVNKLRILNRPNKSSEQNKYGLNNSANVQEMLQKSFEEKQAEYAKARLRILGEEMPTENLILDVNNSLNQITLDTSPTAANMSTSSSTNSLKSMMKTSKPNIPNQIVIIREPAVPDGTIGFRYNRNLQ